eukprot:TRINITY_DN3984_c0_g1_i13.p1 TRINITY_DN3984_c0_g1~~TRINITY_DN3984_c0_g1_i13.p1  ORF type:complete len:239 (+),score=32.40 TRINITY_DN3984_c0_g1_i13:196-912(+)
MNGGNWCNSGYNPCNLDPWARAYLGWVDVQVVPPTPSFKGSVVPIAPGTSNPKTQVYQLRQQQLGSPWVFDSRINDFSGEFFLLENRATCYFFDKYAPGSGLVLWHIDYNVVNDTDNDINCGDVRMITVTPADGVTSTYGDAGDPFPGTSNITSLSCENTGQFHLHSGACTCESMSGIDTKWSTSMTVIFNAPGYCSQTCCGDSEINVGEECDSGNTNCVNCKCTGAPYDPPQVDCKV